MRRKLKKGANKPVRKWAFPIAVSGGFGKVLIGLLVAVVVFVGSFSWFVKFADMGPVFDVKKPHVVAIERGGELKPVRDATAEEMKVLRIWNVVTIGAMTMTLGLFFGFFVYYGLERLPRLW